LLLSWYRQHFNRRATTLMLVFLGVSLAPFSQLSSTDLVSIGFFMLATALFLRWVDKEHNDNRMLLALLFFVSVLIPPFLRYGYYPVVFIFPIFLGLLFLLKKDKLYLLQSIVLFAALGGLIA